jgi:hypothetical protein
MKIQGSGSGSQKVRIRICTKMSQIRNTGVKIILEVTILVPKFSIYYCFDKLSHDKRDNVPGMINSYSGY